VYYSGFFIKKHVTCQVIGAFWYLFSIERQDTCWHEVCKDQARCDTMYRYCGDHRKKDYTFPTESCPFIQPDQVHNSTVFNFGIFIDALDSGVVESTYCPRKFFYCFWWGLRNLRFVNILFSISVPNQSPCSHLYYLKLHPALIHF
jgi:cyclic nucleotide gated channel